MNLTQRPIYQRGAKPVRSKNSGKDKAHLGKVAMLPCVVCHHYGIPQRSPTQVHHCIHGRYGTNKVPDLMTIPLCEGHHLGDFDTSQIALHRDPDKWKAAFGLDVDYIHWTQDRTTRRGQKPVVRGECAANGCGQLEKAGGFCMVHYRRNATHGDPLAGRAAPGAPLDWIDAHAEHSQDECLIWPFGAGKGYASVMVATGQFSKAHRLMCIAAHGNPAADLEAAHSCGNRRCVNPKHLRWATPSQNAADKDKHGTAIRGSDHKLAKLSEMSVAAIRTRWAAGEELDEIAADYTASRSAIWLAATGKTWKHVPQIASRNITCRGDV